MDITTIATSILSALPGLIQAGQDVLGLIQSANSVISAAQAAGRDPTAADWAALQAQIAALEAKLDA